MSEAAALFLAICIGYGGGSLLAVGAIIFFENLADKRKRRRKEARYRERGLI